ncbi:MAG: class I SAM-dependent methyltransferase [Deltaproteobacteria bacterium]|nr:class I SAM-dependent methyltransferase [Deltaproteobacteria bacterium]MBW1995413.1 class I SAM-dependent methyltransferase [Deltaproteobacteria bacterium]MBW2150058.1 class I SAM-dependent methyltransferase [Deltaproteobacteria bacterium]
MTIRAVAKGLLTFLPGTHRVLPVGRTGGTNSARYCYGVWLKHLTLLWQNNLRSIPDTLAELGPGDSLGVGLAAMLSGVNHYYALDVVRYSNPDKNHRVLDELIELFGSRSKLLPTGGWPDFYRYLGTDLFPSHILTGDLLQASLARERIQHIRNAIKDSGQHTGNITIRYIVPWSDASPIAADMVDVIISQSVMEHVSNIDAAYRCLYSWLKPGGMMSHQIDFKSHGLSKKWNGFRAYSELLWKIIAGKRTYLLNRQPVSVHIALMEKNGFDIVYHLKKSREGGIQRRALSPTWREMPEDDLMCSSTFIIAQKH